jgi:DNA repair exonuclease SbcCD ATPase subunit
MWIAQLDLFNFGSLRSAQFTFDAPITLIYGQNAAGKSSVADAIQWNLTNVCRGTDARGAGVDNLIAGGADAMKVGLVIGHDGRRTTVIRGVKGRTTALEVDGAGGSIATRQAELYAALGVTSGLLTALCESRAFLDLSHQDAKAMLLRVLNVRVTVDGEALTLEQLDTRYNEAFDQRKTAKATLAAIRVPPAPEDDAPDVALLEAQLADLREEEKRLLAAAATDDGRRETLEREHRTTCNDLARLEHSIDLTTDLTAAIDALDERIALLEPAEGDEPRTQAHRTRLAEADGRLPMLERTLSSIATHDPKKGCVLDGAIPCKTAASHFAGQVGKLEQEIVSLKAQKDQAREALEAVRAAVAKRTRLESDLKGLKDRQAARAQLLARQQDLQADRDRRQAEIAALPAPAEKSPALTTLQARIAKGQETIAEARLVVDAWHRHTDESAKQQAASKRVADLEQRVERLGPKGARVQALDAAIGTFEAAINDALARFGYELRFQLDPWDVQVNGRSLVRLSVSERLRVGLSLQLALADVTGLGFVVIDGADILDAKNRRTLVELLDGWEGQAIVTATRDDPPAPMEGVAVYWLTCDRSVTHVERIGEAVTA